MLLNFPKICFLSKVSKVTKTIESHYLRNYIPTGCLIPSNPTIIPLKIKDAKNIPKIPRVGVLDSSVS